MDRFTYSLGIGIAVTTKRQTLNTAVGITSQRQNKHPEEGKELDRQCHVKWIMHNLLIQNVFLNVSYLVSSGQSLIPESPLIQN